MNIIINAAEAIDHDHGIIGISSEFSDRDNSVIVRVSDNGRGIDPALWDTIFDPFVTSRQTEGGTGLGLSITYNLVQAHGGDISFYPNEEGGTTFRIAFPAMHS